MKLLKEGGCSSVGRAPALQAGGRRFDPDHLQDSHLVFLCLCIELFENLREGNKY